MTRSPSVGEKRELGGMYERGVDFPVFRLKFLSSVPTIFCFSSNVFFLLFFCLEEANSVSRDQDVAVWLYTERGN